MQRRDSYRGAGSDRQLSARKSKLLRTAVRETKIELLERRVLLSNVTLSVPNSLNAFQGGVAAVPVYVNQLNDGLGDSGMSGAKLVVDYDSSKLSVSGSDIFDGTSLVSGASLFTLSPSFSPGQVQISITAPVNSITSAVGSATGPITITTASSLPPGLNGLNTVNISGVSGFSQANGTFGISLVSGSSNQFTLNGTTGITGSGSGGNWSPLIEGGGGPGTYAGANNDSLVVIDFHEIATGGASVSVDPSSSVVAANGVGYSLSFGAAGSINVTSSASAPNLGYFTPVTSVGTGNGIGTMLVLNDGSIMVDGGDDGASNNWYRLIPDSSGNYSDGTWHTLANSNVGRLFFGSVVMQNGDVMVMGGEDTNISGSISSIDGTASGIQVTTSSALPTDLTSGTVGIKGATFGSFKINQGFNFTVTGTNTFLLTNNGANTITSGHGSGGTFSVGDSNTGEIFTPPTTPSGTGSWHNITSFPLLQFGDNNLELQSDGTVLAGDLNSGATYRYNPALDPIFNPSLPSSDNPWTLDANLPSGLINGETAWTKLPDGSILSYALDGFADGSPQQAGRLVFGATQASDQWVFAGNVPVPLGATGGAGIIQELGPAFLLPDGRVFDLGANGNTALYSPPALAGNSTGTWVTGPIIPNGSGATDAPGAMMVNGDVLFDSSPYMVNGVGADPPFQAPTTMDEYNPTTNTITVVPPNNMGGTAISDLQNALAGPSPLGFESRMVDLPNGQVLFTDDTDIAYVYTPNAAPNGTPTPLNSWRPVVTKFVQNADGSFTLTGTQITGISEGAGYGDDAQMASNYPIIELTDGSNVDFATTTNWSTAGVQTGSTPETVQFTLPSGTSLSDFSTLVVTANGIPSQSIAALASPNVMSPGDQSSVEGASTSFKLGSFIDPSGSAWTVDVNWGDGTTDTTFSATPGTIPAMNHTYGEEGSYKAIVTVTDTTDNLSGSANFNVAVSDPAVIATGGLAVAGVEGANSGVQTVATFTDPGGAEPNPSAPGTIADHYSDTIDWGDSTPTTTTSGNITFSGGVFSISGAHTYGEEGTYTITVTIHHETAPDAVATSTATISDPAVIGTGTTVKAIACLPLTGVTLATYTDPGGAEPNPSDPSGTINDHYKIVSINWGDGTPLDTTSGLLSFGGSPGSKTDPFIVSGSHVYASEGTYTVTTIIQHEAAPTTTVLSTVIVRDNIGLLALDPTGKGALTVTGNGGVLVNNCGAVVVDSNNASAAAIVTGNGFVSAMDVDVTGGASVTGNGILTGPIGHETPTADPIGLPLPAAPATTFPAVNYTSSTLLTLSPGTYVGGIHISGHGNVVLSPGVYYLKGGGLQVTGQGSLTGNGVLIINAPATPSDSISFAGQGNIVLTAAAALPAPYAAYTGITLFQDPTSTAPINLSGGGSVTMDGALYAPNAVLNMSGNGGLTDSTDTTAPVAEVIVYDAVISGNGILTINADAAASNPPAVPPLPTATSVIFTGFTTSANPSVPGQLLTLTATISPPAPGLVDFFDLTTHLDLGFVTIAGGIARVTTANLMSLGSHVITANYFSASPSFKAPPPSSLTQQVQSEAIEGTALYAGGNNVQVQLKSGQVVVDTHDGSPKFSTPLAGLTSLVVSGVGNGASIQVDNSLTLPAFLFAGNGFNDSIEGGGGPTVEVGGSGGSVLEGGSGRSILIAGHGGGTLQGGNGGSILIGGYTDYDSNLAVLQAALAEWSSTDMYATRLAALGVIFNTSTVHNDGLVDRLQGAGGNAPLDWFFASALDQILNKNASETLVTLS